MGAELGSFKYKTNWFAVHDLQECIDKCKQHEECRYFNYKEDWEGNNFGECWLKTGMGKVVTLQDETSSYYFGHRNSEGIIF